MLTDFLINIKYVKENTDEVISEIGVFLLKTNYKKYFIKFSSIKNSVEITEHDYIKLKELINGKSNIIEKSIIIYSISDYNKDKYYIFTYKKEDENLITILNSIIDILEIYDIFYYLKPKGMEIDNLFDLNSHFKKVNKYVIDNKINTHAIDIMKAFEKLLSYRNPKKFIVMRESIIECKNNEKGFLNKMLYLPDICFIEDKEKLLTLQKANGDIDGIEDDLILDILKNSSKYQDKYFFDLKFDNLNIDSYVTFMWDLLILKHLFDNEKNYMYGKVSDLLKDIGDEGFHNHRRYYDEDDNEICLIYIEFLKTYRVVFGYEKLRKYIQTNPDKEIKYKVIGFEKHVFAMCGNIFIDLYCYLVTLNRILNFYDPKVINKGNLNEYNLLLSPQNVLNEILNEDINYLF